MVDDVGDIFFLIGIGYATVGIGFTIWYYAFKKQSGGPGE